MGNKGKRHRGGRSNNKSVNDPANQLEADNSCVNPGHLGFSAGLFGAGEDDSLREFIPQMDTPERPKPTVPTIVVHPPSATSISPIELNFKKDFEIKGQRCSDGPFDTAAQENSGFTTSSPVILSVNESHQQTSSHVHIMANDNNQYKHVHLHHDHTSEHVKRTNGNDQISPALAIESSKLSALSKLSLNSNTDEFVLIGGHPDGDLDVRSASIRSVRSAKMDRPSVFGSEQNFPTSVYYDNQYHIEERGASERQDVVVCDADSSDDHINIKIHSSIISPEQASFRHGFTGVNNINAVEVESQSHIVKNHAHAIDENYNYLNGGDRQSFTTTECRYGSSFLHSEILKPFTPIRPNGDGNMKVQDLGSLGDQSPNYGTSSVLYSEYGHDGTIITDTAGDHIHNTDHSNFERNNSIRSKSSDFGSEISIPPAYIGERRGERPDQPEFSSRDETMNNTCAGDCVASTGRRLSFSHAHAVDNQHLNVDPIYRSVSLADVPQNEGAIHIPRDDKTIEMVCTSSIIGTPPQSPAKPNQNRTCGENYLSGEVIPASISCSYSEFRSLAYAQSSKATPVARSPQVLRSSSKEVYGCMDSNYIEPESDAQAFRGQPPIPMKRKSLSRIDVDATCNDVFEGHGALKECIAQKPSISVSAASSNDEIFIPSSLDRVDVEKKQEPGVVLRSSTSSSSHPLSERMGVVFCEMPVLYSHPDDDFNANDSVPGVPFRPTSECGKTPPPKVLPAVARTRSGRVRHMTQTVQLVLPKSESTSARQPEEVHIDSVPATDTRSSTTSVFTAQHTLQSYSQSRCSEAEFGHSCQSRISSSYNNHQSLSPKSSEMVMNEHIKPSIQYNSCHFSNGSSGNIVIPPTASVSSASLTASNGEPSKPPRTYAHEDFSTPLDRSQLSSCSWKSRHTFTRGTEGQGQRKDLCSSSSSKISISAIDRGETAVSTLNNNGPEKEIVIPATPWKTTENSSLDSEVASVPGPLPNPILLSEKSQFGLCKNEIATETETSISGSISTSHASSNKVKVDHRFLPPPPPVPEHEAKVSLDENGNALADAKTSHRNLPHLRPSFNNSFERTGHPAAAVLKAMLNNRISSEAAQSKQPALVSVPVNTEEDVSTTNEVAQMKSQCSFTFSRVQNRTPSELKIINQNSSISASGLINSRSMYTSTYSAVDVPSKANISRPSKIITTSAPNSGFVNARNDAATTQDVKKDFHTTPSQIVNPVVNVAGRVAPTPSRPKAHPPVFPLHISSIASDARWEARKPAGASVRTKIQPGKIRQLAAIFENSQNTTERSHPGLSGGPDRVTVIRTRHNSEPSLSESFFESENVQPFQDDTVLPGEEKRLNDEFFDDGTSQIRRSTIARQEEYGLEDAFLDVSVDSHFGSSSRYRTSTPLNEIMNSGVALAAQFNRIPSIRAENIPIYGSYPSKHDAIVSGNVMSSVPSTLDRKELDSETHEPSSSIGREMDDPYEVRIKISSRDSEWDQPKYRRLQQARQSGSSISTVRTEYNPQGELLNNQIDKLFGFVDDHEEDRLSRENVCSRTPGTPVFRDREGRTGRPLTYSMSSYRHMQRAHTGQTDKSTDPAPRFSPANAPHAAELSQSHAGLGSSRWASAASMDLGSGRNTTEEVISVLLDSPRISNRSRLPSHDNSRSRGKSVEPYNRSEILSDYRKQIQRLQSQKTVVQRQVSMVQKALQQARREHKSLNELNAQRSLLMMKERDRLLHKEIEKLHSLVDLPRIPPINKNLKGSLTISSIQVELNKNFVQHPHESATYAFIVLLKCGHEVEAMAPVTMSSTQHIRKQYVEFPERVNFSNLPVDYAILLEVYVMVLPEYKSQQELSCAATFANKCRNLLHGRKVQLIGGLPVGEFVRCGYTVLNKEATSLTKIYLDDAAYPLEGTIEVHTRCTTIPAKIDITYSGFLTMHHNVSGITAWERYWSILRHGTIYFWKFPDDEREQKPPNAYLDLSACVSDRLAPCSVEQCPREFTFMVDVLVHSTPSMMRKDRIILAADCRELMDAWLQALNETISIIRG